MVRLLPQVRLALVVVLHCHLSLGQIGLCMVRVMIVSSALTKLWLRVKKAQRGVLHGCWRLICFGGVLWTNC